MTPPFVSDAPSAIPAAIKEAYLDMCATMSNRFDQSLRRPNTQKWRRANVHPKQWDSKKAACWHCRQPYAACATCKGPRCATCKPDCAGTIQPITNQHLIDHLSGAACYAACYADAHGMTRLFVADDDKGGIETAQAAVDYLYVLGVIAFAIARRSLDDTGADKHDGSRLFWIMDANAPRDVLKRAGIALLAPTGYSIDEVMDNRAELPFGRSRWTPDGDEYGTLVLAGYAPTRILSGIHGMELLAERTGLAANDTAYVLSFAPPAPPKPEPVTTIPTPRRAAEGSNANVPDAFNAQYSTIDVLGWAGCQQHPWFPRNYHCTCSGHDNGDKTPSIAVADKDGRVFFNSPRCHYHNDKRPWAAFALYQHLIHGGDFIAAMDGARKLLMLPEWAPDPDYYAKHKAADAPDCTAPAVVAEEPITVARILEDIRQRLETGDVRLSPSQLDTLRAIARLCLDTGTCTASWDELAERTGYSTPTVRRAAARLEAHGLIAKHHGTNERGAWGPNTFQILPQPKAEYGGMINLTSEIHAQNGDDQSNVMIHRVSFDQSILSTIKEKGYLGEMQSEPVAPHAFTLFNSPLITTYITERVEFKRRYPQPRRIERYAAIPAEVYAAYVTRITDESRQPDMSAPRPNRSGRVILLPAPTEHDITPDHEVSRWEVARRARLAEAGIAVTLDPHPWVAGLAQPDPSPPLIAPPEPMPAPVSPRTNQQIVVMPRRRIETAADLAPEPVAETPQATLAELAPQIDQAAAAGDKAALVALLGRLGALDRALAGGQYNDVLCQFGLARRIAR